MHECSLVHEAAETGLFLVKDFAMVTRAEAFPVHCGQEPTYMSRRSQRNGKGVIRGERGVGPPPFP